MEEGDTDWERAHLIGWERCGGERHRLGESALDIVGMSGRERCQLRESALDRVRGVGERDADWERAHLIRWKGMSGGGRHRLGESALDRVGLVWRRETPTGRERT